MIIYTYFLYSLFLSWFLATIVVQFSSSRYAQWLKTIDTLSILPLWTFFAPNPGVNDYHLLYREESNNGQRSDWQEIAINEDRKLSTSLWNPSKRGKKILSDVIQNVIPILNIFRENPKAIMFSIPYILILNAIMKEENIMDSSAKKQFLLVASDGYGSTSKPKILLISEFHRTESAATLAA